jgi:hypothetical protein
VTKSDLESDEEAEHHGVDGVPVIASVGELVAVVEESTLPVYVRFSGGLDHDREQGSVDHESGLSLPGLSANPLRPPSWWTGRPVEDWVTRQVRAYHHLKEKDDERRGWLIVGTVAERGPDNEPLLADVRVVGVLSEAAVAECGRRQPKSPRDEDSPDDDGSPPWQSISRS